MGVAAYVVIEKEVPSATKLIRSIDGKALARALEELSSIAGSLNVAPLLAFFSASPEMVASVIDLDASDPSIPPEAWFDPTDGLKTADALLSQLRGGEDRVDHQDGVVAELEAIRAILIIAREEETRFHMALDI
jgi:hypothetical protein